MVRGGAGVAGRRAAGVEFDVESQRDADPAGADAVRAPEQGPDGGWGEAQAVERGPAAGGAAEYGQGGGFRGELDAGGPFGAEGVPAADAPAGERAGQYGAGGEAGFRARSGAARAGEFWPRRLHGMAEVGREAIDGALDWSGRAASVVMPEWGRRRPGSSTREVANLSRISLVPSPGPV